VNFATNCVSIPQTWGDMLLPFTAGTFLYVGTVAVIPELLETGPDKALEVRKTLGQFAAIAVGALTMLYISWHD
jgi:solute carrier family 39 (zinc transporter), member 7